MLKSIPQCIILEFPDILGNAKDSCSKLHCGNDVNMPYWMLFVLLFFLTYSKFYFLNIFLLSVS